MKNREQLKKCISNIELLGADARFENDREGYDMLKIKLESIEYWAKQGQKALKKVVKESDKNA